MLISLLFSYSVFLLYKKSQQQLDVWIDIFISLSLLGLCYCTLCLGRVFKKYDNGISDLPSFMLGTFFFGAFLPSIATLEIIGSTVAGNFLASNQNFPPVGYQALQVAQVMQTGSTLFLISSQFLFIAMGVAIAAHLSFKTGEIPAHHARMGVVTAIVGFLCFTFEIATFSTANLGVTIILGILTILWSMILLPVWLIWLGVLLVRLKQHDEQAAVQGDDIRLTSV